MKIIKLINKIKIRFVGRKYSNEAAKPQISFYEIEKQKEEARLKAYRLGVYLH